MNPGEISLTILGCGSSGGVPRIGGDWGVCDPNNSKNRRTRCCVLVEYREYGTDDPTIVLVDTSPDLREQLLAVDLKRLDAVLYTHYHADQCHGIDDLRAIAYMSRKRIPVHMDEPTYKALTERFGYCFEGKGGYPAILDGRNDLRVGERFSVDGPGGRLEALPMDQDHGGIRSLGFRFGPIAYCNDVVQLPEETLQAIEGVETLIVDALRYDPHPSHAHLAQSLEWIERTKPKQAILTNLHVDMDYQTLVGELPGHVIPAHDGLRINGIIT